MTHLHTECTETLPFSQLDVLTDCTFINTVALLHSGMIMICSNINLKPTENEELLLFFSQLHGCIFDPREAPKTCWDTFKDVFPDTNPLAIFSEKCQVFVFFMMPSLINPASSKKNPPPFLLVSLQALGTVCAKRSECFLRSLIHSVHLHNSAQTDSIFPSRVLRSCSSLKKRLPSN